MVGKLHQADEHLLVIKGLTRSARAGRRQVRDEKSNLDSVKSSAESSLGIEGEYRNRHIGCQTEEHHESSVGRTQAYATVHKMCLEYSSELPNTV